MEYILYDEALKRFKETGITQRLEEKLKNPSKFEKLLIEKARSDNISADSLMGTMRIIKNEGYHKSAPINDEIRLDGTNYEGYRNRLRNIIEKPGLNYWVSKRGFNKDITQDWTFSDLRLFDGSLAAIVLSPEELWAYEKFGFRTGTELISTVSTYVLDEVLKTKDTAVSEDRKNDFHSWRKSDGGKKFIVEIKPYGSSSLKISTIDVTEYQSGTKMFDNDILIRPLFKNAHVRDEENISVDFHSTGKLLYIAIKYAQQEKINSLMLKDNAKMLKSYLKDRNFDNKYSMGEHSSIDHYFGIMDENIPEYKHYFDTKVAPSKFNISGAGIERYFASIKEGKLAISTIFQEQSLYVEKEFERNEVDDLIKGLVTYASTMRGGTSVRKMTDLVNHIYPK